MLQYPINNKYMDEKTIEIMPDNDRQLNKQSITDLPHAPAEQCKMRIIKLQ